MGALIRGQRTLKPSAIQIYRHSPAFSLLTRGYSCCRLRHLFDPSRSVHHRVLRANAGQELHFLALAAVRLSLTPVYHRFYDTRLLLLTIPAVLIVQKRRLLGTLIAVLTTLSVVSVQYRVNFPTATRAMGKRTAQ